MATESDHPVSERSPSIRSISRRDMLRMMGFATAAAVLPGSRALAATNASETPLAGQQAGFYRFKIGNIQALSLLDGGMAVPPAQSPFAKGQSAEAIKEALGKALLPTDVVRFSFSVLLLNIGGELVLIDAGAGPVFGDAGGRLPGNLKMAGVDPKQISKVIITHMHGDHFGGLLDAQGSPMFPKAQLFIHSKEYDFWTSSEAEKLAADTVGTVRRYLETLEGNWEKVKGGDEPVKGVKVVDAFGHTPGHMNLTISSGDSHVRHIADCAHHHALSYRHPEWTLAWDVYTDMAKETRQKVIADSAASGTRIYGGHMPFPGLGHARSYEGAYEYLIEPWMV